MPEETVFSGHWNKVEQRVAYPVYKILEPPTRAKVAGVGVGTRGSKEAANINSWGEVPDSTWFTNRIGRGALSEGELLRREETGPDMDGKWTVIGGKSDGVSSGFTVRDASGDMYFVKFDVPGHEGLITGAEIISTLIMNAAGYNVPYNHLCFVEPEKFVLGDGAKIPDLYGEKRKMNNEDLAEILSSVAVREDGTIRIVASKALEGVPIGPFIMEGTRRDDPNDRIRHEDRRELRAAHVFAAWLNNPDYRVGNTLDMYVGEPGKGHVRHNIIDFGSSLGSSGFGPKDPSAGYDLYVDYETSLKNLFTLGFHEAYWEKNRPTDYRSVGLFEHENFDPYEWAPWWPNPAWMETTPKDAFWAARIISRFTDEDIDTIVAQARLNEPGAERYMAKVLKKRRDKVVNAWFSVLAPLDDFRVEAGSSAEAPSLVFQDLAVTTDLSEPSHREYRYAATTEEVSFNQTETVPDNQGTLRVPLSQITEQAPAHGKITLSLSAQTEEIGGEVEVYLFCKTPHSCLITGLHRNY